MRAPRHVLSLARMRWLLASLLMALLLPAGATAVSARSLEPGRETPQVTSARAVFGRLPLAFERNEGQGDPSTRFIAHGQGYALALALTEALLSLTPPTPASSPDRAGMDTPPAPASALHFRFSGANPIPAMNAEQPLSGIVNYLVGNDPTQWHTNIPTTARVRYTDLYPGLDLVVYGTEGGAWEYDVIVAPGADPAAFALAVDGATGMTLDAATGDLVLGTAAGEVRQHAPTIYQEVGGERRGVTGGYALREDGTVGFVVGAYDPTLPLVIDPTLIYSTYLGGNGLDQSNGIAVDTNGNAYVTGDTFSLNFPVMNGSTFGGGSADAFVTKMDGSGTRLYSTYLGGNGTDAGNGIAVDTSGNAYVTGVTSSTNFPVTNGSTYGGNGDAFVTEFDGSGTRIYSTYLGGAGDEVGYGIAVDTSGNAYVTGLTQSMNFPVTNGSTYGGFQDAFVTKIVVPTIALSPATLPNGMLGTPYSQTITASGGTGPYTFAVTMGTLPPGLTLATNGTLSGTPTSAGSFTFVVTATDHGGDKGSRTYTLVVPPPNPLPALRPGGGTGGGPPSALPPARPGGSGGGMPNPVPLPRR